MSVRKILDAAAGATSKLYADDVFSTYLYTGNGSTQTITNGIDLAGKGGLVWIKARNNVQNNLLYDTVRGASSSLQSNSTAASGAANGFDSFTSTGFTLINDAINQSTWTYASFAFRKAAKFFDCGTFTTAASGTTTVNHNLGSTPGMIIIKNTQQADSWLVYHKDLTSIDYRLVLNTTAAQTTGGAGTGAITAVSATSFTASTQFIASNTHVYYAFAHDTTTDGLIQCGSFTTDGSGNATVTLGWEPQFVLYKHTAIATDWIIGDSSRGLPVGSQGPKLNPNSSAAEGNTTMYYPTATGFQVVGLAASQPQIYLAIRRPNKPPTSGTQVYYGAATAGTGTQVATGFDVDLMIRGLRSGSANNAITVDRLRGAQYLVSSSTAAEVGTNNPFTGGPSNTFTNNVSGGSGIEWLLRRAPGVFDVVCYTGNGTIGRSFNHSLGVTPELLIIKCRGTAGLNWAVCSGIGASSYSYSYLNLTNAATSDTYTAGSALLRFQPTSSLVYVTDNGAVNTNSATYVAYLFATKTGISYVGSYTGNGSNQTINCGFSAGARFILIKRTDSTGDWYVWDSTRGIIAGNDPHLSLNTTAAEVTTDDTIDPDNSGFIVNQLAATNVNVNTATYIFLAFA